MKKYYYLLGLAVVLVAGGTAQAEDRKPVTTTQRPGVNDNNNSSRSLNNKGLPQEASDLIGMEVRNLADEKLGKVEDLVVNLGTGRASYVILSTGGVFGVGAEQVVVPAKRFSYRADDKKLVLDADKELLKNAPAYDKERMPDWNNDEWNTKVEEYFERTGEAVKETIREGEENFRREFNNDRPDVEGRQDTGVIRAERNERNVRDEQVDRDGLDKRNTVEGQGSSRQDVETTRQIRQELMDSDLSTAARNVQVITRNGEVILRGTVKTEQEREQVVARAKRAAGSNKVTDRLQIAK